MNGEPTVGNPEEREWLIEPGEWVVEFVTYRVNGSYGGRYVAWARPVAGPFVNGVPRWHRDQPEMASLTSGFDDPALAYVPRYYRVRKQEDRVAAEPKSDFAREWYRLTGEILPRYDRIPLTGMLKRRARVLVVTVRQDSNRLPCPPYSKIERIIGPADEAGLSKQCWESVYSDKA